MMKRSFHFYWDQIVLRMQRRKIKTYIWLINESYITKLFVFIYNMKLKLGHWKEAYARYTTNEWAIGKTNYSLRIKDENCIRNEALNHTFILFLWNGTFKWRMWRNWNMSYNCIYFFLNNIHSKCDIFLVQQNRTIDNDKIFQDPSI